MYGEAVFRGKNNLDIEAKSKFVTVRANVGVFNHKYYYEVKLLTAGLMQIGFCTLQTPFSASRGVGDDKTSFAYDGFRVKKWNHDEIGYGEAWGVGDIIGVMIDFKQKFIQYWRNKKSLGRAFINIPVGPNQVYFPALSMQRG